MYSDIIYETDIIVKLLSHMEDIVLVIDQLYRLPQFKDSKLDLAVAEKSPINNKRSITKMTIMHVGRRGENSGAKMR